VSIGNVRASERDVPFIFPMFPRLNRFLFLIAGKSSKLSPSSQKPASLQLMNFRVIVAGLAGGVAIFLWGFVAHMLLPLGQAGMEALPDQAKVLPAISASVKEPGLYIFPWPESPPGTPMPMNQQAQQAAAELYRTSPHGLLLFHPPGGAMLTGGQLLAEFSTNCITAMIAASLVSWLIGSLQSFLARMLFVTMLGLLASIAVNVPYWNWYEFPGRFTLAEMLEHVVGFGAAGLVIAALVKPSRIRPAEPSGDLARPVAEPSRR
jgi:hypothetical protein